jgi:protein-tyrosine-phosphatase
MKIGFICNGNSARSQIAERMFENCQPKKKSLSSPV